MSTPIAYADRYSNLQVELASGTSVTVNVHQYRLGAPKPAKDRLWSALKEYFQKQQKLDPGFRLRLRVNGGSYEFSSYMQMPNWIVRPFTGKGSPECCQVVLQLAVLLGEATPQSLQTYCDTNLGLDCNGFVGNFLYYEDSGHNWMDEPRNGNGGPNDDMTVFAQMGPPVTDTYKMSATNTYVCIETLGGVVIPGGKAGVGHIAITEPNKFMPQSFVFDSFASADLGLAQKGAYGHHAFMAVESTGGIGLTQSWYAFPKSSNPQGIYRVFRGSKGIWMQFKIVDLGNL